MRTALLGLVIAFTALLGALTIFVLVTSGPDLLVAVSALVVSVVGFGAIGALTHPPPDREG